jgi:hypothetical protein
MRITRLPLNGLMLSTDRPARSTAIFPTSSAWSTTTTSGATRCATTGPPPTPRRSPTGRPTSAWAGRSPSAASTRSCARGEGRDARGAKRSAATPLQSGARPAGGAAEAQPRRPGARLAKFPGLNAEACPRRMIWITCMRDSSIRCRGGLQAWIPPEGDLRGHKAGTCTPMSPIIPSTLRTQMAFKRLPSGSMASLLFSALGLALSSCCQRIARTSPWRRPRGYPGAEEPTTYYLILSREYYFAPNW